MADSDDYGDEFDDTEFVNAATQAEKENNEPASQTSLRPAKRQKVSHAKDKPVLNKAKKQQNGRRNPFPSSDESENVDTADDTLSDSAGEAAELTEKKRPSSIRKHNANSDIEDASPAKDSKAQKRKERIHVPTTHLDMTDMFYTQPPQEHSPPWKPRGAIWAKPTAVIGVHKPSPPTKWTGHEAIKTMSLPGRQSISSRPKPNVHSPDSSNSSTGTKEPSRLVNLASATVDFTVSQELADLPSDAFASSASSSPQKQDDDDLQETGARRRVMAPQQGLRQTTLFGRTGPNGEIPPSQVNKRYNFIVDQKQEPPTHHKLDSEAIQTWVYPTNLGTIRDYQFNIVQRGLFNNLLVALPTGLGKTFIAATIMLNWFRWTKEAQIVFVAPTKPLVSQQVGACFNIAGIPRSATTMLTGGVSQGLRSEEWRDKRVFFMTPQTLLNDLKAGYADPKKIVLLVVDEAHRATGSYAYVEVVSFLRRFNQSFRVLALTATPGADVEAVQKVIDGLDISKVEIRTESSMDICSYVHQRKIEKHVFQNSEEMEMCMELYSQALQPLVKTVAGFNAYWSTNPLDLTPFGCQQAKKKWFLEAGRSANQGVKNIVNNVFTILASISHGMDLLKYHGIGPFYMKMKEFQEESVKTKSKYKKQILDSDAWMKLVVRLKGWVKDENFVGHPKLDFLQQVILDHFVNAGEGQGPENAAQSRTRIMVFAHFRDSAEEIVRILKRHQPMIRPRVFVGQAHGKNSEGMNQKEQLDVIEKFKLGTYNTLIATSIGEEGLDIGEVDLIICYDSKASPIRMLQRMGRTGRKREGKIVMLQMQGKEENDAMKAKDSYERMQEIIANGTQFNFHEEISRRILPSDVRPVVDRRVVDIPIENSQQDWLPEPKKGRRSKKPPKKFHMPDNVLTGFVTAGKMDEEIVPKARKKKAVHIYPSEEVFDFPPLESILLNEKANQDLERRFQTVFDDDDSPMIGELDLGHCYEHQRVLTHTHLFNSPGRVTQSFVGTMQRMHDVDNDRLDAFRQSLHHSDCETDLDDDRLISDTESKPPVTEDMWADDDPASQSRLKPNKSAETKSKPKTKAQAPATKGRPRKDKDVPVVKTPVRRSKVVKRTPHSRTPNWRMAGLAQEGEESSPPPTDPRFHIASQADTIGSDDTIGEDEMQDPHAHLLDSELASFIVEDEEDVDVPASSLPSLNLSGVGRGTQAVVTAAQKQKSRRAEKLFTSDPTDDDAVVSSDSDDNVLFARRGAGTATKIPFVVESASDDDIIEPVVARKRVRRIIDDDEDE